ncbi:MAG: fluoroquinolone resistance protein [Flavobacteriales bacterium]
MNYDAFAGWEGRELGALLILGIASIINFGIMIDEEIIGKDFREIGLRKEEVKECTFRNCNFAKADLSHTNFVGCRFEDCDLSMANMANTALKEIEFVDCKMVGIRFELCNPFLLQVGFSNCQMTLCSFYELPLGGTEFKNCQLHEAEFSSANLSKSSFDDCDLSKAVFEETNLEKVDFRSASHFAIEPERNRMKGARFSLDGLPGLLSKHGIKLN